MTPPLIQALGVTFYNGDLDGACLLARRGGLVTAPSGPGLAQDLVDCLVYRRALGQSDLVLADCVLGLKIRHSFQVYLLFL